MTAKVILDSNFLFIPSQFHVDIFEELESLLDRRVDSVLLSPTYQEIEKMADEGSPKMRQLASLALKFTQKCRIVQVEKGLEETCDDVIVRVAREWMCPVATNDRTLRRKLRSEGIPVVFLRQKNHLELEGAL